MLKVKALREYSKLTTLLSGFAKAVDNYPRRRHYKSMQIDKVNNAYVAQIYLVVICFLLATRFSALKIMFFTVKECV